MPLSGVFSPSAKESKYRQVHSDDGAASDDDDVSQPRRRMRSHPSGSLDQLIASRTFVAAALGVASILTFMLGFAVGDIHGLRANVPVNKFATITASTGPTVFDVLRALPPADIEREYGISPEALKMYPEPLGSQICILNVDTRQWQPSETQLEAASANHFGYINHYLYAKLHGYSYKYIRTHEEEGFGPTWVKVKEQFRHTMKPECRFTVVMDADTIFSDIRIPLEALLGHWNVTDKIAITGGRDLDKDRSSDEQGRTWFNTGFVITQNTPEFPRMMHDWINCPKDIKYKGCSKWKHRWSNEQAAFSNYIRYDYPDIIRELPVEEIHLGGFVMHYWSQKKKVFLRQASHEAISNRFFPDVYTKLIGDWNDIFERTTPKMYEEMMEVTRPQNYTDP